MGQRLLVSVLGQNERELMNIYYHWSGYTISSLEEASELIKYVMPDDEPCTDDNTIIKRIVTGIVGAGGGFELSNPSEKPAVEKLFKSIPTLNKDLMKSGDRNEGIIIISKSCKNEWIGFEDFNLTVDLIKQVVTINSRWECDTLAECIDTYGCDLIDDDAVIRQIPYDYFSIPFNELDKVIQELTKIINTPCPIRVSYDGVKKVIYPSVFKQKDGIFVDIIW